MSNTSVPAVKKQYLTNTQYDALKWVALVGLPALGALYYGLAKIWNLPSPEEIVGTITLVDTFLGLVLGVAKKSYDTLPAGYRHDGALEIDETDSSIIHTLNLTTPPEQLGQKDVITLAVTKAPPIDKE